MKKHDVLIIGGGLAGLTAAIHLALQNADVAVFETNTYPHHKVCGEYVSKEIEPYLNRLGVNLHAHGAVNITEFQISTLSGNLLETQLPLGGFGISRYALDNILFQRAKELGVQFYFEKVVKTMFQNDSFRITTKTQEYTSKIAIGAYGKRSILDKNLGRKFSLRKHSWLAVKGHYLMKDFPEHLVGLHNFEGGYGGLSKTETGAVNFCYLANYKNFKKYKDVSSFTGQVVAENPHLKCFLDKATLVYEQPLTIAQIAFDKKETVVEHMLMSGDTAGLIHPLCGNGMAMAIHSSKVVSELIVRYLEDTSFSRLQLEQEYKTAWSKTFGKRIWVGRKLQSVLLSKRMVSFGLNTVGNSTKVLNYIISKTHGELVE